MVGVRSQVRFLGLRHNVVSDGRQVRFPEPGHGVVRQVGFLGQEKAGQVRNRVGWQQGVSPGVSGGESGMEQRQSGNVSLCL